MPFNVLQINTLIAISFLLLSLMVSTGCSVSEKIDQERLESSKNKSTDKKIATYFSLLSNISNNDINRSFELSFSQTQALNRLEAINNKQYLSLFVVALDNDSPVIRQAAINQMLKHKYYRAIPKLIAIMNEDLVTEVRLTAMTALGWFEAKSACKSLVLLTSETKDNATRSRALTTLADIKCPQTESIFLAYFKSKSIIQNNNNLSTSLFASLPKLKSETFTPYLIKLTQKNNKTNHNVLSALQEIGGTEIEAFFAAELNSNSNSDEYKADIVNYILKMNSPRADVLVMDYIDQVQDSKSREQLYYAIKREFVDIKRRRNFSDRLIANYEKEDNEIIKTKIIFMLTGIIKEKHISKLKLFYQQEKNESNKCNILLSLATIPSKTHYNFMAKFDNEDQLSWCQVASKRYKKLMLLNKTNPNKT